MIGRKPILTIGFGTMSECSRNRVPKPPQKSTTFIVAFRLRFAYQYDLTRGRMRIAVTSTVRGNRTAAITISATSSGWISNSGA